MKPKALQMVLWIGFTLWHLGCQPTIKPMSHSYTATLAEQLPPTKPLPIVAPATPEQTAQLWLQALAHQQPLLIWHTLPPSWRQAAETEWQLTRQGLDPKILDEVGVFFNYLTLLLTEQKEPILAVLNSFLETLLRNENQLQSNLNSAFFFAKLLGWISTQNALSQDFVSSFLKTTQNQIPKCYLPLARLFQLGSESRLGRGATLRHLTIEEFLSYEARLFLLQSLRLLEAAMPDILWQQGLYQFAQHPLQSERINDNKAQVAIVLPVELGGKTWSTEWLLVEDYWVPAWLAERWPGFLRSWRERRQQFSAPYQDDFLLILAKVEQSLTVLVDAKDPYEFRRLIRFEELNNRLDNLLNPKKMETHERYLPPHTRENHKIRNRLQSSGPADQSIPDESSPTPAPNLSPDASAEDSPAADKIEPKAANALTPMPAPAATPAGSAEPSETNSLPAQ